MKILEHRRYKLLLAAILIYAALVFWPLTRRLRAMQACYDGGNVWDFSARICEPPVNPHPTAADSAAARGEKPRTTPAH